MTDPDEVVLPALLRAARGAYSHLIHDRLVAGGFDDIPRNGPFVLGGLVNHGGSVTGLTRELGVTKQAASQLVDTLVVRGYLERVPDPQDGRRMSVQPTSRGRSAASAVRAGVAEVDGRLADRLSADELRGLRAGLVALCDIREEWEDRARGG
ncbi:MarR family winged helix-turn-helix transcriptional regulator [Cellulomonas sp. McL0617]|uniref:MarR family winged helix-turn-helix transcriptional regulator n=1 Tax=Cellulomonas sp. McL0617 TaxID=3415675 RepID=UPI003CF3C52F